MKAPTNKVEPLLNGYIVGAKHKPYWDTELTFRGYCSKYRLKPNLSAYVRYAKLLPSQPITYTHQWYRNGKPISGATSSSYTLTNADRNANIKCITTPIINKQKPLISLIADMIKK